ncbi:hypothetical protein [Halobacteriovorax marinus]|uniref:hypothetical protein n=1 Tax=Halobacteriovorax marinus TaxID=97084 RepID=UPI003A8E73A4
MNKKHLSFFLLISLTVSGYLYREYSKIVTENTNAEISLQATQKSVDDSLKEIEEEERRLLAEQKKGKDISADGMYCFASKREDRGNSIIYLNNGVIYYKESVDILSTISLKDVVENNSDGGLFSVTNKGTITARIIKADTDDGVGTAAMSILSVSEKGLLESISPKDSPEEVFSRSECGKIVRDMKAEGEKSHFVGTYCSKDKPYEFVNFRKNNFIVYAATNEPLSVAKMKMPVEIGQLLDSNDDIVELQNLIISKDLQEEPSRFKVKVLSKDSSGNVSSFAPSLYLNKVFSRDFCTNK